MVNAGETIVDATMAAFPNQNVVLPIGLRGPRSGSNRNLPGRNGG